MRDPAHCLKDDSAWRYVRPFHGVSKARDIRYTDEEVRRLIDNAENTAVSELITGAYLTGARYGELADARVGHYDKNARVLRVMAGKTGARTIILQASAAAFFELLVRDREPEAFLFTQVGGQQWKRSDQTRPLKRALKNACLPQNGSIYALRHTYISRSIEGGVPLNVIAENCGTSVRIIEKNYAKILAEKRRDFIERGAPSLIIASR